MKSKVLSGISMFYVVAGCLFTCATTNHLAMGIVALVSFIAANEYSNLADDAKQTETLLSNQWYECGEHPDY